MIRISVGNVGSGKTANEVREMFLSKGSRKFYTNIKTTLPYQIDINPAMIIKKNIVETIHKRSGEEKPVYDYSLNVDFWKKIKEPINVVIDEAHTVYNSRKSMSKTNIIVGDWLALIRRVLGENSTGHGDLVFITQLPQRIDIIAREMAHQIRHHKMHYKKRCFDCGAYWRENSDMPEPRWTCPFCGRCRIERYDFVLEIHHFKGMQDYIAWHFAGEETFYKHYLVNDISRYFDLYDTLQWDNMFTDF